MQFLIQGVKRKTNHLSSSENTPWALWWNAQLTTPPPPPCHSQSHFNLGRQHNKVVNGLRWKRQPAHQFHPHTDTRLDAVVNKMYTHTYPLALFSTAWRLSSHFDLSLHLMLIPLSSILVSSDGTCPLLSYSKIRSRPQTAYSVTKLKSTVLHTAEYHLFLGGTVMVFLFLCYL